MRRSVARAAILYLAGAMGVGLSFFVFWRYSGVVSSTLTRLPINPRRRTTMVWVSFVVLLVAGVATMVIGMLWHQSDRRRERASPSLQLAEEEILAQKL